MRGIGIKLVVIDTPPAITATIVEVIRMADLVVMPTRPSPHDLRAVGATVESSSASASRWCSSSTPPRRARASPRKR